MTQNRNESSDWHQLDLEKVIEILQSSGRGGLTPEEAQQRMRRFGPNELIEKKPKPLWMMFMDQFKDFMILVLIAAAVVAGFIGEPSDSIAIAVIVLLNAILGFVQEYRAEKAMAALKKLDKVAYVRFASVYRSFEDVKEFGEEIARLFNEPQ